MLPLLQMHQMVQPSLHPDSPSSPFPLDRRHARLSLQRPGRHPMQNASSTNRDFPIRTSQPPASLPAHPRPASLMIPSHMSEHGEHHLRRKTPNGTIDAGYDGTPTQLASGPPPLKHMILPVSNALPSAASSQRDYRPVKHALRSSADGWAYAPSSPFNRHDLGGLNGPGSSFVYLGGGRWQTGLGHGIRSDTALDCAPNGPSMAYYPYNNGAGVPTVLQPTYQHPPGPAVFNNGGLIPPPAWPDAIVPGCHPMLHPSIPTYHGLSHQPVPDYRPEADMSSGMSFNARPPYKLNSANLQAPSHGLESLTLDSTRYATPGAHLQAPSSPTKFREKALAFAHRSYVELLSYLHHNKKSSSRSAAGSRSSSKMVIFPKLPKPPNNSASSFGLQHTRNTASYTDIRNDNYAMSTQAATGVHARTQSAINYHYRGSEVQNPAFYHFFNADGSRLNGIDSQHGRILASPLSGAKAAIEMLTHLCEQSGWEWIDGMLLGGCLHYGLEHYEQSLEWFQRIISLDANHVEALSNVAATLYCLNRHEEAENHWLQAVRRRPSFLEAVEHLVGLLCSSHRSKEAVDIIDFVQRSIRIPDNSDSNREVVHETNNISHGSVKPQLVSHGDPSGNNSSNSMDEYRAPGFGSSGYCVAGSENGRVIALIHAKGNMLYALKDIDRASEAFEEAVLISSGKTLKCIHSLIRRIQLVLSPDVQALQGHGGLQNLPSGPLLLPPERARHTARLVFASHNELPGLRFVPDGIPKKTAISTTSNSLLSLAKIFQDAMSNGGSYPRLMRQPPGVGDILALYYLSLSLSESPSTANNVGILLASIQQPSSTPLPLTSEYTVAPQIPGITPGSGLALALAYYNYGLNLDSKHVHLHTNLGSLLKDIGQLDLAIQMYEQAVACDGDFDIALTNLANAVKDRGRISDAIMYYKRAVSSNPQFAEAVCGLSTALNSVCDWRNRGGVVLEGGKYDRWHVDENGMLRDAKNEGSGSGLMKKVVDIVSKQLSDSSHWGTGMLRSDVLESLLPQLRRATADETGRNVDLELEIRNWAGRPWEGSRLLRLIERATKAAMRHWYQDKYIFGRPPQAAYPRPKLPASLAVPTAPTVLPFHTFTCPLTAKAIRMISQRNAARISCSTLRSPWLPSSVYPPPPPPNPQLNIGYVSSDFNNHPLAHLMQSVFGFHNPERAKAFCYATTASDRSIHRQQIEREAPVFRDVSSWSAERLVEKIVEDEIHILVNLNGYTRGARNEIFAARPAPIQMSFMGFAGTLGAEWCDYLLADEVAIPPSTLRPLRDNLSLDDVFRDEKFNETDDWVYSENIIFCRDTFFCCDHAQSCDPEERTITWKDELRRRWGMRKELFPNLPDDTIILGNFNQLYKIDPSTFRTWLRILSNVPKAVLWLLRFPELGEHNLKRTAKAWAGDEVASRIIFTDVAPKQQHISRARVCDLFLDTPECNAHTTAADVLWSSTPLLTLPRYPYKMCSRMAASILKGALPKNADGHQAAQELIAANENDYEILATRLAGSLSYRRTNGQYCEGIGRLAEIRKILFEAKWTCALFDTHRWVDDLEDAYEKAWQHWVAGEGGDIYL
ncbi:glycosyl transferase family 41-domain-containing protein [Biscogniauxia mediterranea]|nr:glycosyl transferase family 41-domain-containing protein [Biscogniauxia mediterranea]